MKTKIVMLLATGALMLSACGSVDTATPNSTPTQLINANPMITPTRVSAIITPTTVNSPLPSTVISVPNAPATMTASPSATATTVAPKETVAPTVTTEPISTPKPRGTKVEPTSIPFSCNGADLQKTTTTLDNVDINICTSFLPSQIHEVPVPKDYPLREALGISHTPLKQFDIGTAPFGKPQLPDSIYPPAKSGAADAFRQALRNYRIQNGGKPQQGPTAILFGQRITSIVSIIKEKVDQNNATTLLVVDWVVEAGSRLWTITLTYEQPEGTTTVDPHSPFLQSLTKLNLSSTDLDNPTTVQ